MEKVKLKASSIYSILVILSLVGCQSNFSEPSYIKVSLGLDIAITKQEYYYAEKGLQEEGFSFEINNFSKNHDNIFLGKDYPIVTKGESWHTSTWKETPFVYDNSALDLLLQYDVSDQDLKSRILEVKKHLLEKGNYFSYYYKIKSGNIYSIQCYVIDVINNKLYTIKVAT